MPVIIKPEQYIPKVTMWDLIDNYLKEHYGISDSEDYLISKRSLLNTDDSSDDSVFFKKGIHNLATGETKYLERMNLYRLAYVLDITTRADVDYFFSSILHVSPLSARSLEEFLFICALRFNMSWVEFKSLYDTFEHEISAQRLAPKADLTPDLYKFQTLEMAKKIDNFKDKSEIIEYVKNNIDNFSHLNNTQYIALLPDIAILHYINAKKQPVKEYVVVEDFFDFADAISKKAAAHRGVFSYSDVYDKLYRLYIADKEDDPDYLTNAELKQLQRIFPEVFLSLAVLKKIIKRIRIAGINPDLYLLAFLQNADDEVVFNSTGDRDSFKSICNKALITAGFPEINESIGFEKLILDVFEYTINEMHLSTVKTRYLFNLRKSLRLIIDACTG